MTRHPQYPPAPVALPADQVPCVEWLTPAQHAEWDAFVERHPLGTVYHLSAWKTALESCFPHIQGHRVVVRHPADRHIVAGLPIFRVDSWLLGSRLASIPLASLSCPLFTSDEDWKMLWTAIGQRFELDMFQRVEIKLAPTQQGFHSPQTTVTCKFKHHFTPLDKEPNQLLASFSKLCRRLIVRAQKNNFLVQMAQDSGDLLTFHRLFAQTRQRLGLPLIPLQFFQCLWDKLHPQHMELYIARRDQVPVGALLCLKYKQMYIFECLGEDPGMRNEGVNQLLFWEAIQQAHREKYACFSWGRTAVSNSGLMEFKRRWATVEENLPTIVYPPQTSDGASSNNARSSMWLMNWALAKSPGPIYRQLSQFCYRHWG